jgi:N-methylhydantoinase A/oxoprolinase/acetone carboxylase beta subunit
VPLPPPPAGGAPAVERAEVTLPEGTRAIPFYARDTLASGFRAAGPCVVEEPTATTFVPAGWRLRVDHRGCLDVTRYE